MCKVGDFIVLLFLLLCSISDLRTRKISTMLLVIMSLFMVLLSLFFKRQGGGEIVVTAFFLTGFVSLMGIVFKKWKNSVTLPFIPFLTVSYLGVLMI